MVQTPTYEELEKRIVELEKEANDFRLAEEELALEKKRLASLIEHSSLAIVTLDAQHNIVSCNRDFEKLFQYKEKEIRGKNLDRVIAGRDEVHDAVTHTQKTTSGIPIQGRGKRYKKDGDLFRSRLG